MDEEVKRPTVGWYEGINEVVAAAEIAQLALVSAEPLCERIPAGQVEVCARDA